MTDIDYCIVYQHIWAHPINFAAPTHWHSTTNAKNTESNRARKQTHIFVLDTKRYAYHQAHSSAPKARDLVHI